MAAGDASPMECPRCAQPWLPEQFASGKPDSCRGCGTPSTVYLFPALTQPLRKGIAGEQVLTDSEASCFYHPNKRAATVCDSCGRYLCSLCDIQFHDRHLCSGCLENGRRKNTLDITRKRATLYDDLALGLAILPVLLVWPTVLTAPATIVVVLRYWRAKPGVTPRRRGRSVAALLIALLQIAGWLTILFFALKG